MFVPGQFGTFPPRHSRSGTRPNLGGRLPPVESYDDLFCHRHATQPWILDSRPRDALNTHPLRRQGGQPTIAPETFVGRPADHVREQETTPRYLHAYLHADDPGVLPLDEDELDAIQVGGKRNYGYGVADLEATRVIDLDTLSYDRFAGAEAYCVELLTPFVLETAYPGANGSPVPWWWGADRDSLRLRAERLVDQREGYDLTTVDHGQVVAYTGDQPIETARNGVTRVGPHSRYGFGECRVHPIEGDAADPLRVVERRHGLGA